MTDKPIHNYHFGQIPEMPWHKLDSLLTSSNVVRVDEIETAKKYLNELHPQMRRLFVYYLSGYTQKEIGNKLGMSQPAVSRNLKKIKRELHEFCNP